MIDSANRDFCNRITPVMHGGIHSRILACRADTMDAGMDVDITLRIGGIMSR
jgi:hypothetical protein